MIARFFLISVDPSEVKKGDKRFLLLTWAHILDVIQSVGLENIKCLGQTHVVFNLQ